MIEEVWKDIKGYEGRYQISNLGNVCSLPRIVRNRSGVKTKPKKLLKPCVYHYLRVTLYDEEKKPKYCDIHRLVAKAFLPNPDNLPVINHKDGNRQNNAVTNLEWCTQLHNVWHAILVLGKKPGRKRCKKD